MNLLIHFTFNLLLVEINVIASCEDTFDESTKEISYPPINSLYVNGHNCSWSISAPIDRIIDLTFIKLNIDASNNCEQSSLAIFDGSNSNSTSLEEKICGSFVIQNLESTGNEIYLSFTTNGIDKTNQFTIKYGVSG